MGTTKRLLITTADERSWKLDRPVLFLGEWCRRYDRMHIWSKMDAIVAGPYGLGKDQETRDMVFVQALASQLLTELTEALNRFHQTRHGKRYWNIVLGHWLQRYVAILFNRYFTLEQALRNYEIADSIVFDSSLYCLATADTKNIIWACNDDIWNHVLYSKILSYWGHARISQDTEPLKGLPGFIQNDSSKLELETKVKLSIRNAAERILSKICRVNDAFIINTYLPLKEEFKLQLSLGQCPQLWRSPALKTVALESGKRLLFGIDVENYQGFERFIRLHIREIIPICYLEGYSQLVQQAESLPWPAKPKFIFTSNNFDTDEVFKAWVGSKVEKGIPYFTGQHGNNYGTHVYFSNRLWPELAASDKFITWGWQNINSKDVPAFVFKNVGRKSHCWDQDGGLLLMELHSPFCFTPQDSYFEFGLYQEEQFRFVAALPRIIQETLTVRLHAEHRRLRWFDEQRWKDRSPHVKIETGERPINKLVAKSRVVVHSYDSTGILETLNLNIPTMCFWQNGLNHLLPSARPYYELLRKAGILFDTPEQTAEMVALHWDNVSEWWGSKKVQDARKSFCEKYARTGKRPIRTMKQLLTNHETKNREQQ